MEARIKCRKINPFKATLWKCIKITNWFWNRP